MSHTSGDTDNHKAENNFIPSSRWGEDVLVDAKLVERNLFEIKQRIAPCKPRIIGVTKYFGLNAVISGYEAGLRDFGESRATDAIIEGFKAGLRVFGESRANDAIVKIQSLPNEIRQKSEFHFIVHLQTNKVNKVVEYFDYIHSVDSLKLARAFSASACSLNKKMRVLFQVNNACEVQKTGYSKEELRECISELCSLDGIQPVGLMNMAPLMATSEELRNLFRELREFRDELERDFNISLPELSMGMSNDYEIAVKEGATIIRIGRSLFT